MQYFVLKFHINKSLLLLITALFLFNLTLNAQVTQIKQVDVAAGLKNGTIQVTVTPPFTIDTIEKIFDGNAYTEAAVQNSDTLEIILNFEDPVKITKSKVFFWNSGLWKLEAANNPTDLNFFVLMQFVVKEIFFIPLVDQRFILWFWYFERKNFHRPILLFNSILIKKNYFE